jgi:uncharacterized protein YcfJ
MHKLGIIGLLAAGSLTLGACATHDRYGYPRDNRQLERAATGAAIGGAVGAGVGAVVDGVSPVAGAAAGAVVGGAIGAATSDNRRWVRDSRGYCYYVDEFGRPVYDYNRRC